MMNSVGNAAASAAPGGAGGAMMATTAGGAMSGGGGTTRTSSSSSSSVHRQATYTRQATILRKNLAEWDMKLRDPRGEDWPSMLGRLNAAHNQAANMDRSIEAVLEHFVYLPKKCTMNPQDIPFFLSTRLETQTEQAAEALEEDDDEDPEVEEDGRDAGGKDGIDEEGEPPKKRRKKNQKKKKKEQSKGKSAGIGSDPVQELARYEGSAAQLAAEYEENMVRF